MLGVNFENSDVTLAIESNNPGFKLASVLQRHLDVSWISYNMTVSQNVAVLRYSDPSAVPGHDYAPGTYCRYLSQVTRKRILHPICQLRNTFKLQAGDNFYHPGWTLFDC